jgi:UDP-glucose 4-epimerase
MELVNKRILLAGGAGFISSQLAEVLLEENQVVIVDDLSNGQKEWAPNDSELVVSDLTEPETVTEIVGSDFDFVFHLAARKDPNDNDPREQFMENTTMTRHLLERCNEVGVNGFAFASSSTVYGEAPQPTPEDYAPLEPISAYGAGKLGEEGLVPTYAHSHELDAWVFRFANVVGPRLRGAVIPDFLEKLRSNPDKLQILGNGLQEKSYMHVTDCIDAMCHVVENATSAVPDRRLHTFNLGTETTTSVNTIADIVCDVLRVDPEYEYTGGKRGWTGDVPRMRLSIEKLSALGWKPNLQSTAAVRKAAEQLADEIQ